MIIASSGNTELPLTAQESQDIIDDVNGDLDDIVSIRELINDPTRDYKIIYEDIDDLTQLLLEVLDDNEKTLRKIKVNPSLIDQEGMEKKLDNIEKISDSLLFVFKRIRSLYDKSMKSSQSFLAYSSNRKEMRESLIKYHQNVRETVGVIRKEQQEQKANTSKRSSPLKIIGKMLK